MKPDDVATVRLTLLAMLENLAKDEAEIGAESAHSGHAADRCPIRPTRDAGAFVSDQAASGVAFQRSISSRALASHSRA